MIIGSLFLLGGAALILLGFRMLRALHNPGLGRTKGVRLVISTGGGQDAPQVALWRGADVVFGPCRATWDPPQSMRDVPAPTPQSGVYRVLAAVDLSAEDAFGTDDPRLAGTLREGFGTSALLLEPVSGDRPVLLHGTGRNARSSAGGVGIEQAQLDKLIRMLGDPAGLRVEVVRRRVQRAGWGGAQGQRHRARQ